MTEEIRKEMDKKFEELFGNDSIMKTVKEQSNNDNCQDRRKEFNPFESIFDPMDYITGRKKMVQQ